ncbi:MAG TPA: DinB family protein, partial [Blastocatellia bacterium]|nr:DinB family protein [Blastocatellia bacterium]
MSSRETDRLISTWNRVHNQSLKVMRVVPEERMDWRPSEGMFTLRELVWHLPESELGFVRATMAGSMQKVALDLATSSPEEIVSVFEEQHRRLVEEVATLDEEKMNEEIEVFGKRMKRKILLWSMTEHEIH